MPVSILVKSSNENLRVKVSEVSLSAKKHGGQYLVKINLDKTDSSVLSGMFVNVQFPLKTKRKLPSNMILIPESALIRQAAYRNIHHREWKCTS
jgi:hypothetical protein